MTTNIDDVRVSINKTEPSGLITIEVRSSGSIQKIEMDQENFTNSLFGRSEVEAKRRTRIIEKHRI